jgi:hypothetical protein
MPYDPNIPTNGEIVDADELREQFAALHEENTATNARIDEIPAGPPGADGAQGGDGPAGPPFAQAIVDAVNTLEPGESATIEVTFDGTNVHFTFNLPRGADGTNGAEGAPGAPGEVSQQQLSETVATEIAGTARDPVGVEPFGGMFSDLPTQGEMQAFAEWAETLRAGVRRG